MTEARKQGIYNLLKVGIETGDAKAVAVVNEAKYIQHNPQTHEGSEGLATLFARLAKTSPRVKIVRLFSDGDFVFGHTEYDFSTRRIGYEVFRFEGEFAVEHWDNIQSRKGPNPSGRSMVDGPTEAGSGENTESTRALCRELAEKGLIGGEADVVNRIVALDLIQHNPEMLDGRDAFSERFAQGEKGSADVRYEKLHRVLAEGSFALTVCEGTRKGVHSSFYDLYRVEGDKVVEHWDTIEKVPPASEWKNDNGKF